MKLSNFIFVAFLFSILAQEIIGNEEGITHTRIHMI